MASLLIENESAPCVLVVGNESVGKSQLISSLTGRRACSSNFRGSSVACEVYAGTDLAYVDTPGILHQSDTATTRAALERLQQEDIVLLVVQATHLDDDLAEFLPLVQGKRGAVAVTFWDKISPSTDAKRALDQVSEELGVPLITLDARRLSEEQRARITDILQDPPAFERARLRSRAGWCVEPRMGLFGHWLGGPALALCLLLIPPVLAVCGANLFAGWIDPFVGGICDRLVSLVPASSPQPLLAALMGDYGLITMGPMLLTWAVPTILIYAVLLAGYKSSGLVDRINDATHAFVRPLGLSGRDLVRIVMGFGCNVPAVISTRACSSCSRGTTISAISFGAACSYQLPATLAVFAACGQPMLVIPFALYMALTTIVFIAICKPKQTHSPFNVLVIQQRTFMQWPSLSALWRETSLTLRHFFVRAMPIFLALTLIASLLDWLGMIRGLATVTEPVMALFRLPADAALPVVMASVRKDGILLFLSQSTQGSSLAVPLNSIQVLTGVYLAGVLLPCLVTALTVAREQSWKFAGALVVRQCIAAASFSMLLAWGGWIIAETMVASWR